MLSEKPTSTSSITCSLVWRQSVSDSITWTSRITTGELGNWTHIVLIFQETWNYFCILYHSSRLMAWEILPRGRHWLLNSLRPRQHGRHFADDTFKPVFLYENIRISIKISRKFVSKVPINNITALVQIMAWRRPGDKPLSEPMMVCLLTHICVTRPQWVNLTEPNPWLPSRALMEGINMEKSSQGCYKAMQLSQ